MLTAAVLVAIADLTTTADQRNDGLRNSSEGNYLTLRSLILEVATTTTTTSESRKNWIALSAALFTDDLMIPTM